MHQQSDDVLQTLQSDPWTANQTLPPWTDDAMDDCAEIKRTYHQHKHLILKERKNKR